MVCYIQGLVQIFTNIKTHEYYTSGFCLNWAVCGPTHNWDHWQLILMSSREQNSHCCTSLLVTAGLPFLGLLAGWAAAIPKSHKSSLKLMLIANFCYIKILFFSLFFVCCSRFFPCALSPRSMFALQVLFFHSKDSSLPQLGKIFSLRFIAAVLKGEKIFYFFLFQLYS